MNTHLDSSGSQKHPGLLGVCAGARFLPAASRNQAEVPALPSSQAGPASEPASPAASSRLLPISPMTPMRLSAGIILTNPFTHFAQKSAS